ECRQRGVRLWLRRGAAAGPRPLPRPRVRAGHPHDRGQVHVLEVVTPGVDGWIEWETLTLRLRQAVPEPDQVPGVEDAVHLRVDAVQLGQVERALEACLLLVEVVRPASHAEPQRESLDQLLSRLD